MDFHTIVAYVVEFVRANEGWALPIVFALAFGESLAFISLLIPATVALVGIGALIGVSGIAFVPIWIAASLGATAGDWLSFWFGATFKEPVARMWPLSRYPGLIPRGERFVERFGVYAVAIGRFSLPMPFRRFYGRQLCWRRARSA
jgi:membrane protein DedA with SNARE-associated domain